MAAPAYQPDPMLTVREKLSTQDISQDEFILPMNKFMNFIDIAKDLKIGGFLTGQDAQTQAKQALLKRYVREVLGGYPAELTDATYQIVADNKERIFNALRVNYYGGADPASMRVIRPKHSSGHSASPDRPSELYVAQDNGSLEVVSNPKLIITPGSIIDPAGKTKTGATDLTGSFPNLPAANFTRLGLSTAVSDATMSSQLRPRASSMSDYILRLGGTPQLPPLTTTFNGSTFDAISPPESVAFFAGNRTKNERVSELLEAGHSDAVSREVKYYVIIKELGDTLQVEWLNRIFEETNNTTYTRENTVVITTDSIVCYRCLVNKVGVIHTDARGVTRYYFPRANTGAAKLAITKTFIITIQTNVVSKNEAVIQIIEDLIKQGAAYPRGTAAWINSQSWDDRQRANCIVYLRELVARLVRKNRDLNYRIGLLNQVADANALAQANSFRSPFVKKRDGYYYYVRSANPMYTSGFNLVDFTAINFTQERHVPAEQVVAPGAQAGGVLLSSGGQFILTNRDRIAIGAAALVLGVPAGLVVAPASVVLGLASGAVAGYAIFSGPTSRGGNMEVPKYFIKRSYDAVQSAKEQRCSTRGFRTGYLNPIFRIFDINTVVNAQEPAAGGANPLVLEYPNPGFLYCFLKVYCPEVFTYGYIMLQAYRAAFGPGEGGNYLQAREAAAADGDRSGQPVTNLLTQLTANFVEAYLNNDGDFEFDKDLRFILNVPFTHAANDTCTRLSIWCVRATITLLQYYPGLQSPYLNSILFELTRVTPLVFDNELRTLYSPRFATGMGEAGPRLISQLNQGLEQVGGGNTSNTSILQGRQALFKEIEVEYAKEREFQEPSPALPQMKAESDEDPAMDEVMAYAIELYELYYSILEASSYLNSDPDDILLERLVILDSLLKSANDPFILNVTNHWIVMLSELPKVKAMLPQAEELLSSQEEFPSASPDATPLNRSVPIEAFGGRRRYKKTRKTKAKAKSKRRQTKRK